MNVQLLIFDFLCKCTRFLDRVHSAKHPKLKQLYDIMLEKKTNLCIAADFTNCRAILDVQKLYYFFILDKLINLLSCSVLSLYRKLVRKFVY